jgi:macrolide transport system ATP-binding/permease protein
MSLIELHDIKRHYFLGGECIRAMDGVSLSIESGEFVAIIGPSGSGKSTLMNILGCLDSPTSGTYNFEGKNVSSFSDYELTRIRNSRIGFVFQSFHLLARADAEKNVELPLFFGISSHKYCEPKELLTMVGLGERMHHKPSELSGGQRQRVAIARALVNNPSLILADEPTGNLDTRTGSEILGLLDSLHRRGTTIILVTHDPVIASHAHRIIHMQDGRVLSDEKNENPVIAESSIELIASDENATRRPVGIAGLLRLVWAGLFGAKSRTALSMLGVIIGVAAVIAMIGLGQGASNSVTERIATLGTNLLTIRAGAARTGHIRGGSAQTLTIEDMEAIRTQITDIEYIAPETSGNAQLKYFSKNENVSVVGSNADYFPSRNYNLAYGRILNAGDVRQMKKVCVLGSETAQKLFEEAPAVGEKIRVRGKPFEVIGVLEAKGQAGPMSNDDIVIVPVTTAMKSLFGLRYLRAIYVSVSAREKMEKVQGKIEELLRIRHRIRPEAEDDFNVRSQDELMQTMSGVTRTFTLLLASIAVVSLLVGGIGIMNIMLVSVTERTKEIGLLKALGATRFKVLQQFLTESLIICLAGGFFGIGLGLIIAEIVQRSTEWSVEVPGYAFVVSFGFCVLIGAFFGAWPAWRASRLDPIESLRHE